MQEGGQVEVVDSEEGGRGAGDEDAGLVEEGVEGVEFAEGGEGGSREGEEEGGEDGLVGCVFYGWLRLICIYLLSRGKLQSKIIERSYREKVPTSTVAQNSIRSWW